MKQENTFGKKTENEKKRETEGKQKTPPQENQNETIYAVKSSTSQAVAI